MSGCRRNSAYDFEPSGVHFDGVIALRTRTLTDVDAQIAGQDADIVTWLNWDEPTSENVTAMIESGMRAWDANDGVCDFGVYEVAYGSVDW